jgi:hypothetical protein
MQIHEENYNQTDSPTSDWQRGVAAVGYWEVHVRQWFYKLGCETNEHWAGSDRQTDFTAKIGRRGYNVDFCGEWELEEWLQRRRKWYLPDRTILAVAGEENVVFDQIAVLRFLYGRSEMLDDMDGPPGLRLLGEGGEFSPDEDKISAVILCSRIGREEHEQRNLSVLHNPWAKVPVQPAWLGRGCRQLIPTVMNPRPEMEWIPSA